MLTTDALEKNLFKDNDGTKSKSNCEQNLDVLTRSYQKVVQD